MNLEEKSQLVTAWIEFEGLERHAARHDELSWCYEQLSQLTSREPETALDVILTILRLHPGSAGHGLLAAGPLEDLLAKHGPSIFDRIEQEAAENPSFSDLLSGVWQNTMPDEIWNRVQRCCEPRERAHLVEAWIELAGTEPGTARYHQLLWSHERMGELIRRQPEAALDVVLAILRTGGHAAGEGSLAASPLEDLLVAHGSTILDRIEREADNDASFRALLGRLWQNAMPDEVWNRVQACGVPRPLTN